jgi:hypothetical protein
MGSENISFLMRTRWSLTSCKASFMRTRAAADAEIHGIGMAVPLDQNGETWRHATGRAGRGDKKS